MSEETLALIEQFGILINTNARDIIAEYTRWHMVAAIFWVFVGGMLCTFAINFPKLEDWELVPTHVVRFILFALGMIFIGANAPDLFSPEAVAIHQLILDIRGH